MPHSLSIYLTALTKKQQSTCQFRRSKYEEANATLIEKLTPTTKKQKTQLLHS